MKVLNKNSDDNLLSTKISSTRRKSSKRVSSMKRMSTILPSQVNHDSYLICRQLKDLILIYSIFAIISKQYFV